jgi:RNase H-like domain found in reverse transcriptase
MLLFFIVFVKNTITIIIIVIDDKTNFKILSSYHFAYHHYCTDLLRCQNHGLVLKIGTEVVTFFGYEVRPGSWSLSRSRKDAIADMIFPTNQKQIKASLEPPTSSTLIFQITLRGHRLSTNARLLILAGKSPHGPNTTVPSLTSSKKAIEESVTLHFPDYTLPWIIRSDSSDRAVGAVLYQEHGTSPDEIVHQPIAFASQKYSGAAVNWDTFKKEAYALYYAVTKFGYYLRGNEFVLETDHRNLVWIESSLVPIVVRWRVLLQSHTFQIRHIPGKDNTVADWLSRMCPAPDTTSNLSTINVQPFVPSLQEMFSAVHGGRSLHHGGKRTYLTLCNRFPGHGIPLRVIQDMVSECPICQKDRPPISPLPYITIDFGITVVEFYVFVFHYHCYENHYHYQYCY